MYWLTLICMVIAIKYSLTENKFMNSVRNLTNTNNHTRENDGIRKKLEKYMNECKGENDKDYSYEQTSSSTDLRGYRRGADGATYPAFYGNNQNNMRNFHRKDNNRHVDGYLLNLRQNNECDNTETSSNANNGRSNNRFNVQDNNRNFYNNQNRNNPSNQDYDRTNRNFGDQFPRWKRDFNDKCVSQCIFSYLELVSIQWSPSETAFVQFLQENTPNDRDRIKIVREARRCFSKFVTTEEEDGCEFSRSLNKCLHWNLE
ncbi:putative uncharacterized protein DDB_G0284695 isoform X2 [Onthophagus taurus]|uniref:putative uncharacterized protein DDB_G0284695 isoform X2 n=1 Tax=Onthophagus taurus TaxID=166361 RepID=UPI0039BEC697